MVRLLNATSCRGFREQFIPCAYSDRVMWPSQVVQRRGRPNSGRPSSAGTRPSSAGINTAVTPAGSDEGAGPAVARRPPGGRIWRSFSTEELVSKVLSLPTPTHSLAGASELRFRFVFVRACVCVCVCVCMCMCVCAIGMYYARCVVCTPHMLAVEEPLQMRGCARTDPVTFAVSVWVFASRKFAQAPTSLHADFSSLILVPLHPVCRRVQPMSI